jgi:hypothetical protein
LRDLEFGFYLVFVIRILELRKVWNLVIGDWSLYLYCVRKRTDNPSFSIKGIDGKGEVFVSPFRELEAVVSRVSLEEFASEEIQKKAQEDLNWIKEKAVIHEKVIKEAMRKGDEFISLIPMKFGTVFKEERNLEEALNKHYEQFKATLEKLKGKLEWSLKVYITDKKRFEQTIKEKSELIKEKEKEIASLPEGIAYFMEEELNELLSKETEKALEKVHNDLLERLEIYAEETREGKILEKELTGRSEPMILNAFYLIKKEKVEGFRAEVLRINKQLETEGLSLEYSGPWPPYNFI